MLYGQGFNPHYVKGIFVSPIPIQTGPVAHILLSVGAVALPHGLNGRGLALSIHPIQTPGLKWCRPISLLVPCFMARYGEKLHVLVLMNKHQDQMK